MSIKRHSLGVWILVWGLLLQMVYVGLGWFTWASEATEHHQPALFWGWDGWFLRTFADWCVNASAESFGAALLVYGAKWFFEKGSPESREDKDPDRG